MFGSAHILSHAVSLALAQTTNAAAAAEKGPLVADPAGILAVLLAVLALIFWSTQHRVIGRIYKFVPSLVFCYFVPTLLTTLEVIPSESPLYDWIKSYVLPASLVLLVLSLDVKGIIRLGPKAIIMLLAGTFGVVIGGPIAMFVCKGILPEDAWRGMSALAGSWIGGGANFVAIGKVAGASDSMLAMMVIPDVFIASIWMGVLLYFAGQQHRIDKWIGADAGAIRQLERRLSDFQERVNRVPTLADLLMILAIGFGFSWLSYLASKRIDAELVALWPAISDYISASAWKYILVTAFGIALSFSRARNLEGAGASKIGSVMIYLLVTCIGASADFSGLAEQPPLILMGCIWMAVHIIVLLAVAWMIRAPIFFIAIGSQANIGGAASAPIVASAFHPSLASVGVLLAVAGYVLGTYAGLVCMHMLKWVAGA